MIVNSNSIINGLWIGNRLSENELLTIRSFQSNGHEFHLWAYDEVKNIPHGAVLRDASAVLPRAQIFRYPVDGKINWGKGSYGGFSDIFRYRFLYERGGWWVDMDVTCLKPFDFPEDYFFRDHWKFKVVGNVMKCPPGSELMKRCYEEAAREVTAANTDWHKPIAILNRHVRELGLLPYRKKGLFNDDHSFKLKKYFTSLPAVPSKWHGIHWVNSAGRRTWKTGSLFHSLLVKHGISCNDNLLLPA